MSASDDRWLAVLTEKLAEAELEAESGEQREDFFAFAEELRTQVHGTN